MVEKMGVLINCDYLHRDPIGHCTGLRNVHVMP